LIFDIKRENFKSTIFIKNPIHPPLGFRPNAKHSVARYQPLICESMMYMNVLVNALCPQVLIESVFCLQLCKFCVILQCKRLLTHNFKK